MQNDNFIHRKNCPICNSADLTTVLSQPFTDERLWKSIVNLWSTSDIKDWQDVTFDLSFCPSCEFYFTKYVPKMEFESRMLERYVKNGRLPERERTMELSHYSRLAFECEKVSSLLARKPNEISILEFGSGFGHWLLMAKAFNFQTAGVEIYEDRIAYAESNALTVHRSLTDVKDSSFDFIFSNQVFEHINEPLPLLTSVVTKLKKGGIMQIGVPQGNIIKKVVSTYTGTPHKVIGPIGHINGYTNHALIRIGEQAGLSLLPPSFIRRQFMKTMIKDKNLRYVYDILLASYKQRNSCYLYFQKPL